MAIGKKVDTVLVPEPFVTMILSKAPDMRVAIDFQEEWKALGNEVIYPITVLTINPVLADERPEVVSAFLKAYADSIAWVNANPEEAGLLIEKHDILKAAMATAAIPNSNLVFIPAVDAREPLESFLSVLLDFEPSSIGGALPDEGFYLKE